ncbi:unnamed protein product [Prorocentrum cordatum]|uniref:Uncharacterized protein n=1 Tax=Prorocentrum cordatum TaxID=2364126 RepID=A0ABN9SLE8_9DINO|nr:unnamed protein product [Polarella glacialis]
MGYLVGQRGAQADARDMGGSQPVHCAACGGHVRIVRYLVEERGAEAAARDLDGRRPVHYAVGWGHLQVAKYLLEERGVEADARDRDGRQPVFFAASKGHLQVVKYLAEEAGRGGRRAGPGRLEAAAPCGQVGPLAGREVPRGGSGRGGRHVGPGRLAACALRGQAGPRALRKSCSVSRVQRFLTGFLDGIGLRILCRHHHGNSVVRSGSWHVRLLVWLTPVRRPQLWVSSHAGRFAVRFVSCLSWGRRRSVSVSAGLWRTRLSWARRFGPFSSREENPPEPDHLAFPKRPWAVTEHSPALSVI